MDDDEEGVLRSLARCWATPLGSVKLEHRATQTAGPSAAAGPENQNQCQNLELRGLFHGNAGFRSHFPALFEPSGGRGEQEGEEEQNEGQEEEGGGERQEEEEPEVGIEILIGRKLRDIGDQFQQEHLEQLARDQRPHLPGWWRLTVALCDFLFQRAARDQR